MILSATDIERAVGGGLVALGSPRPARRVVIDSRCVESGDLFVAVVGPNHDGHRFVSEAFERGAVGVVLSRPLESLPADRFSIAVADTIRALADLARAVRDRFEGRVAAITGSAGKTTTKNLLARALEPEPGGVTASPASFNNHIGVPLTLLAIEEHVRFAVLEIGTSGPGEIGPLSQLARPDVAVVTTIGESHLEGLGDVDGVVAEKGALFEALGPDGVAVLNADIPQFEALRRRAPGRIVTFGRALNADYRILAHRDVEDGAYVTLVERGHAKRTITTRLRGRHNAMNLAGAFAAARQFDIDGDAIRDRLADCNAAPMRMQPEYCGDLRILSDAYNANPLSMRVAIDCFRRTARDASKSVVVLGDMLELGRHEVRCHQEILELAYRRTGGFVLLVGERFEAAVKASRIGSSDMRVATFPSVHRLIDRLADYVAPDSDVLLKASRGMALEACLPHLRDIGAGCVETIA